MADGTITIDVELNEKEFRLSLDNMGEIVQSGSEQMIKSVNSLSRSFVFMPNTINSVMGAVPGIINGVIKNIAGKNPVMTKTGTALFTSLIGDMPYITGKISASVPEITDNILQNFIDFIPDMSDTGNKFFTSLVSNLPDIISDITGKIPEITEQAAETIKNGEPDMSEAGYNLFCAITNPLPSAIKEIIQAPGQIISILLSRFLSLTKQFKPVGENIVYGVWEGISSLGTWLSSSVTGFFQGIANSVTSFLGIHSPSRLFRDRIGKNIALGVKVGIDDEMPDVIRDTKRQMTILTRAADESAKFKPNAGDMLGKTNTTGIGDIKNILQTQFDSGRQPSSEPNINVVMESTGAVRDVFESLSIGIKRVDYLNGGKIKA